MQWFQRIKSIPPMTANDCNKSQGLLSGELKVFKKKCYKLINS